MIDKPAGQPGSEPAKPRHRIPYLLPFMRFWHQASEVQPEDYKLLDGTDQPVQIRPGQIFLDTEEAGIRDLLPGVHVRGTWDSEGTASQEGEHAPIISFLYHKLGPDNQLETTERAIVFRGVAFGVLEPGHTGQKPSWYLVGPQLGTIDPKTGEALGFPDQDVEISSKGFSVACITGGPMGEPVLANPPTPSE